MDIDWIVKFSKTPQGALFFKIFLVFVASEMFRQFAYKFTGLLRINRKRKKKKDFNGIWEQRLVDLLGYVFNIVFGIFMAFLFRTPDHTQSFLTGMWFIVGSMGMHLVYVRYVDKWIKNKLGGSK